MKYDLLSCAHTLLHRLYKAAGIWCLGAAAAVGNIQLKSSFTTLVQLPVTGVKACFAAECKKRRRWSSAVMLCGKLIIYELQWGTCSGYWSRDNCSVSSGVSRQPVFPIMNWQTSRAWALNSKPTSRRFGLEQCHWSLGRFSRPGPSKFHSPPFFLISTLHSKLELGVSK